MVLSSLGVPSVTGFCCLTETSVFLYCVKYFFGIPAPNCLNALICIVILSYSEVLGDYRRKERIRREGVFSIEMQIIYTTYCKELDDLTILGKYNYRDFLSLYSF